MSDHPEMRSIDDVDGLPITDDEFAHLPTALQHRVLRWWAVNGEAARAWRIGEPSATRADRVVTWLDVLIDIAVALHDVRLVRRLAEERLSKRAAPSAEVAYAQALLELGDITGAREISERLSRTHGDLATVQALRSALALQAGDATRVVIEQRAALAADPDNDALRLNLAQSLVLSGGGAEASALLDAVWTRRALLTTAKARLAASMAELLRRPRMAAGFTAIAHFGQRAQDEVLREDIRVAFGRQSKQVEGASPLRHSASEADDEVVPVVRRRGIRWTEVTDLTPEDVDSVDVSADEDEGGPLSDEEDASWDDDEWRYDEEADVGAGERRRRMLSGAWDEVTRVDPDDPRVLETLRQVWGFEHLRPGQAEVMNHMLAGKDTLAIMPTGAGKSLTYQLPAMLLDKPTLVFSPLIALMKDQVDHLPPQVRERTTLLNSSMSPAEQQRALDGIARGMYQLVYVAPERLRSGRFVRALNEVGVARVVVDEAHCITQWGHEFRPDYLSIPAVLPVLGNPPIVAVTATASTAMVEPIERGLGRRLEVVRSSSFRPNLRYEVEHVAGKPDRIKRMLALCQETDGAAIVYVTSRNDTEEFAEILRRGGVPAVPYHAGLDNTVKRANQDAFMRGQQRVVVATIAFGMGVDKPDVRLVVHAGAPGSLEAYAQESGRAGRDGLPSRCVMLATKRDRGDLSRRTNQGKPSPDDVRQVYGQVRRRASGKWAVLDPSTISLPRPANPRESAPDPRMAINILAEAELLRIHPNAPLTIEILRSSGSAGEHTTLWQSIVQWKRLAPGTRSVTMSVPEACDALNVEPRHLLLAIDAEREWTATESDRMTCLELLPEVSADGRSARMRMDEVETTIAQRAEDRISGVIGYQHTRECRHVVLARSLGDRIEACGMVCDVCDPPRRQSTPEAAPQRATAGAADATSVVRMVESLPHPLGKTRLVQALQGSPQARIDPRVVEGFGALHGLKKSAIDRLVDMLISARVLVIDPSDEYRTINVGPEGRRFDDDAARLLLPDTPAPRSTRGSSTALFERLVAWREERMRLERVQSYMVASNEALKGIAETQPETMEELLDVRGIGRRKAEKYGAELLAIVAEMR